MSEIPLSIKEAAASLRAGKYSAVELTKAVLARADALDVRLGVNITRMDGTALAAAARADAAFAMGLDKGPLQGIPLGLKDIISTDDAPTTAQSLVMDPVWSAHGDGPVTARLRSAGAVIVSKNTTMEFANGPPDVEKPFPVPRNPWNPEHWTGGSSSGTAAGVAAGFFLGGIGTDTGGSIRWPAAWCGVTGLKPTYGRVPRSGCTQNGFSLDHLGPIARTAWDCAAILGAIAGPDPTDFTAPSVPVADYRAALTGSLFGLRIGVVRADHLDAPGTIPEVIERFEAAMNVLSEAGATLKEVTVPHYEVFAAANFISNSGEKSGIYLTRLRERWDDWGRYTRAGVSGFGQFLTAADLVQASRVRRYAQKVIGGLFDEFDLLVCPTSKTTANRIDEIGYAQDVGLGPSFTGVWSFVGLPAAATPMGFAADGLPLSLQIVGRPFDEATVLQAADAFQSLTDWHQRVPAIAEEVVV